MIKILKDNKETKINVFIADSFSKRLLGYMFRKNPHHEAIMLKPCNSIHTFFMKFNIDVLFLDKQMQVIKKIEDLKPGQVVTKVRGAHIVIEFKVGAFNNIKEGCKLYF